MIIPVTLAPKDSNPKLPSGLVKISHDEIVLIELQGVLEVEMNEPTEKNGKLVGKLKIDEPSNKPSLLIGHHLLEGKIATLPKPYAILVRKGNQKTAKKKKKKIHSDEEAAEGNDDMVDEEEEEEAMQIDDGESPDLPGSGSEPSVEATSAGWTIAGIVKKKIIFSKRPMPVIGKKP